MPLELATDLAQLALYDIVIFAGAPAPPPPRPNARPLAGQMHIRHRNADERASGSVKPCIRLNNSRPLSSYTPQHPSCLHEHAVALGIPVQSTPSPTFCRFCGSGRLTSVGRP